MKKIIFLLTIISILFMGKISNAQTTTTYQSKVVATNLHAIAQGLGNGSKMFGAGISLRYRPFSRFALEAGADIIDGIDYNGFDRVEMPISLNGLFFLNPKNIFQFYLIGGVDYSRAFVRSIAPSPLLSAIGRYSNGITEFGSNYDYVGAQGGVGLDFRMNNSLSLNIDGLMFIRHRTDHGPNPEFSDPKTGQDAKTSTGGFARLGISLWW